MQDNIKWIKEVESNNWGWFHRPHIIRRAGRRTKIAEAFNEAIKSEREYRTYFLGETTDDLGGLQIPL